jgi:hypothetical protein
MVLIARRRPQLVPVLVLLLALTACSGSTTSSEAPVASTSVPTAAPMVPATSKPDPLPTLAADPTMDPEVWANREDWVAQVNRVDIRVADSMRRLIKAYLRGDTSTAFTARDDWQSAIREALSIEYTPPSPPSAWDLRSSTTGASSSGCWGRVAALYDSTYAWMGKVADQLDPVLLGIPPPDGPGFIKNPEWVFEDLIANYHPDLAGTLTAESIEGACTPAWGVAPPLPAPDGDVTDSVRTGTLTVHGAHAFALIQNVGDTSQGVWSSLLMSNVKSKRLKNGFVSGPTVLLDPGQTGVALMYSESGQPNGWKKAAVDVSADPTSPQGEGPLQLSPGRTLWTSLGLIGITTVTNASDRDWCGYVTATAVRDGVAIGGGYEDTSCASGMRTWTEVIRLYGKGKPTDDLYVRLEMQGSA